MNALIRRVRRRGVVPGRKEGLLRLGQQGELARILVREDRKRADPALGILDN